MSCEPAAVHTAAGSQDMYSGAAAPGLGEYGMTPALHFGHNSSRSGVYGMRTWFGSCGGAARGRHQRRGRGHLLPHRWATANTCVSKVMLCCQAQTTTRQCCCGVTKH